MRLLLLVSLLLVLISLAAAPTFALQPLTPEMPLTASRFGPADGSREPVAVATSGEMGLVVWRDSRESRYFLVMRTQERSPSTGAFPNGQVVADRISLEGTLLSSKETGIRNTYVEQSSAVAGDGSGYLLATTSSWTTPGPTIYPLDREGVWKGTAVAFPEAPPPPARAVRLTRDGDRLLLTWTSGLDSRAYSISYIAALRPDGSVISTRGILYEPGFRPPPLVARIGSNLIAFYGSAAVRLDDDHAPREHSLLAFSAAAETHAAVAAGANGWLAGWLEEGRIALVRRLDPSGAPMDAAPLRVSETGGGPMTIVSNGETYLVAMRTHQGMTLRRLSAGTGQWLDSEPLKLSRLRWTALAAGENALMAWADSCGTQGFEDCVKVQTLPMSGPLTPGVPIVIRSGASYLQSPGEVVIASSGEEFLVAWIEARPSCSILCPPEPSSVRAMRVRPDGTPVDPLALTVEERRRFPSLLTMAWDGAAWVLAWTDAGSKIVAARVTRTGSILGVEGGLGTTVDDSGAWDSATPRLVGHRDGVVLFFRRNVGGNAPHQIWRAVRIPPSADLRTVRDLPRIEIAVNEGVRFGMMDAASRGSQLLVTYDRIDMSVGGVPRGFLRMYTGEGRRRAVRR